MIGTMLVRMLGNAPDHRLGQLDKKQAVIAGVVAEDVGKRRRDNDAKPEFSQRPCGVLPRRSAAEILAGNQHRRRPEMFVVEDEVFAITAIGMIAPVEKQELPESRALDTLEMLLRDDLVSIDVFPIQRRHHSTMLANRFHRLVPVLPAANIDEPPGHGSGGGGSRADEVGTSSPALAAFEITVAG